jgi:hypothetical protein
MLLRRDEESVIAIPQPSHAWVSGQMARAWGNRRFAAPTPHAEVCLAAEQHDIGWFGWETRPTLDAETGLPQEFSKCRRRCTLSFGAKACAVPAHLGAIPRC